MEHIVKTYILLLFSLLVSSIGYAQEENDIIYIFRKGNGALFCVVNVVMLGWIIKEILFSALENYRKFQLMMTLIWSWLKKPCSEEAG